MSYKSNSQIIALFSTGILILSACGLTSTPSPPPSPSQPPPTVESTIPLDSDLCLQGDWVMPTADLDLMIAVILPIPGVRVPGGELLMMFDGPSYRYLSYGFIIHMDLGTDTYMESTASFENTGSFSTRDGLIVFSSIVSESEISSWTGYKNGETYTVPGTSPEVAFSIGGENPYRCSADRLEIETYHPTLETMTLFFTRQP
jgi:hypothetical protein